MNIIICDDDPRARTLYSNQITELAKRHNIPLTLTCYESGDALLFSMEDWKQVPDVVYLDINMPGQNGIQTALRLQQQGFRAEIVFLTVSRDHFTEAFDIEAMNYIVKDADSLPRLERVFLQAVRRTQDRNEDSILLNCVGQMRNIRIKDIRYFEVQRNLMIVHYDTGEQKKKFEFYSTMTRIEELLFGRGFVRVHRSYLVSLEYVEQLHANELNMTDGTVIPVGRSYAAATREAMKKQV